MTDEDNGEAPRPKFSRRPASFSRPQPGGGSVAPATDEVLLTPSVPVTPATVRPVVPTPTPWQEDARFGVAMLVLVLLVNLALVYGLPLLPSGQYPSEGPKQAIAKAPTMPDAMGRRGGVTLYSQPEEERRTIYLLDLRNTSEQNTLSVSPHDIPAPTARALDEALPTGE